MKSLAFFSPLSPIKSGVAHYGDALARELSQYYEITFYIDSGYTPTDIEGLGEVRPYTEYRGREDMTLFQASNGPHHAYMYPYLKEGGAAMTLHDQTLYDLALKYWEGRPRVPFRLDFIQNEGTRGLRKVLKPLPGGGGSLSERIVYNLYLDEDHKRMNYRFLKKIVRRAGGIIAHSRTVKDAAMSSGAKCQVTIIPLGVDAAPPLEDRAKAREALGLDRMGIDNETFVALAFGFIQRHKRIEPLLKAWKKYNFDDPKSRLILLGPRSPDLDIDEMLREREMADSVYIDDSFPPLDTVNRYLFAADLCVNLRYPVYGSSSYSLMQIMAAGRPCVVTDLETFSEFPDEIVIKVPYGDREVPSLVQTFHRARENPEEMQLIGQRARKYIETECLWSVVGPRYHRFLEEIYR